MDESEDRKVAVCCYSFGRDADVQVQSVNVGHLYRTTVIVQGMLKEPELEVCSIWKSKDLWSVEIVSECTQMEFMLGLPVCCGINGIIFRIGLHMWWREPVGQGGVLQSQVSCHMFMIGIANNSPNGRVAEGGGGHVCNAEYNTRKYTQSLCKRRNVSIST